MMQTQWTAVDNFFNNLLVGDDPILEAALKDSEAAGLPAIHVAPNQGKFLMLLAQIQQARSILEIGTLGGYSTIWLGRGMAADGHITTLEVSTKHAEVARSNLARAGLADRVTVHVGVALEILPTLQQPFDMIFIDADKPNNPHYWEWALKLSRPGTLIIVDNVVRHGAVVNADSDDPNVLGTRKLAELVATESRVTATVIQTVGSKGYDGFLMARVLE